MGVERDKGLLIGKAFKFIDLMATPGWKNINSVMMELGLSYRAARRWVKAYENAGYPLETMDGTLGRFRTLRRKDRDG